MAATKSAPSSPSPVTAAQAVALLKAQSSQTHREGLTRFGIPNDHALGVPMSTIQAIGKQIGRQHALADPLWDTGIYEARSLVAFIADPVQLSAAQMDRWCREFDNWAICDTLCFHLFDRSPHAWLKVKRWSARRGEFQRRTAFALLASLAVHDKRATDADFAASLALIAAAAGDERNFVKKGVSWALRAIGHRNPGLYQQALALAKQLAASEDQAERWVGKDTLRDLNRPLVQKRHSKKAKGA
jgi:3-methyladenine DNA glycosylase AlkD